VPQSLAQIYLHIVYSTKHRTPFLQDTKLRDDLHAYLGGIARRQGSPALVVGGTSDHVHLLCRLARTITVADLLRELKRDSSKWLKEKSTELADFHWQDGYGVFSAGPEQLDALTAYIRNQEEHHRIESFQDEYRRFLTLHGVEFDERYVWD
jgi:putative transposase